MRKILEAGAMIILLLVVSGCGAHEGASGTVRGMVVLSPSCPVEMSPMAPSAGTPTPAGSDHMCGDSVSGATVNAFMAGSDEVAASVPTTSEGRFACELPEGAYRFEAVPASPSQGHGVPLDVGVKANSTIEVTLRIDTGVQ